MVNSFFWFLRRVIKKSDFQKEMMYFTNILILFVMQPPILKSLITPLKCSTIDGKLYISSNMNISCDDDAYYKWVNNSIIIYFN